MDENFINFVKVVPTTDQQIRGEFVQPFQHIQQLYNHYALTFTTNSNLNIQKLGHNVAPNWLEFQFETLLTNQITSNRHMSFAHSDKRILSGNEFKQEILTPRQLENLIHNAGDFKTCSGTFALAQNHNFIIEQLYCNILKNAVTLSDERVFDSTNLAPDQIQALTGQFHVGHANLNVPRKLFMDDTAGRKSQQQFIDDKYYRYCESHDIIGTNPENNLNERVPLPNKEYFKTTLLGFQQQHPLNTLDQHCARLANEFAVIWTLNQHDRLQIEAWISTLLGDVNSRTAFYQEQEVDIIYNLPRRDMHIIIQNAIIYFNAHISPQITMETTESMVPFAPTKGGQPSQLIHKKGNNYIFPPGTTEVDKYFGYVMNLTETVTYYDVQMRIHGIQSNLQAQAIKHLKT